MTCGSILARTEERKIETKIGKISSFDQFAKLPKLPNDHLVDWSQQLTKWCIETKLKSQRTQI